MVAPKLTPQEKVLKRVMTISGLDAWCVIIVGAISLLLTLIFLNLVGMVVSALILIAGIMELHGRRKLKRRDAENGMKLLIRSQLFLLMVILAYCARCIGSFDADYLRDTVIPEMRELFLAILGVSFDEVLQRTGLTVADLVPLVHKTFLLLYGSVAGASLLCQGGLTLYYRAKTNLVADALASPPPGVSVLPPPV